MSFVTVTEIRCGSGRPDLRLNQVPLIAVEILEHDDSSKCLSSGTLDELHSRRHHPLILHVEVTSMKKEANETAGLISDPRLLGRRRSAGEEKRCALPTFGLDDNPPLAPVHDCVFDDLEPE